MKKSNVNNLEHSVRLTSSFNYKASFRYFSSKEAAIDWFKSLTPIQLNRYDEIKLMSNDEILWEM